MSPWPRWASPRLRTRLTLLLGGVMFVLGATTGLLATVRARATLEGSKVLLAGQNIHSELSGAYTGEISPTMLTDVGCSHVILGHSERRPYFGETDEGVAKRASWPSPTWTAPSSAEPPSSPTRS